MKFSIFQYHNSSKLPIEGFYLYYRATSSAADYMKVTIEGESVRSYVVTHLKQDTIYEIKLRSFAINAASDFSAIVTQKTEGKCVFRFPH